MFIELKTIKNVIDFHKLCEKFQGDILVKSGRYIIDGKSIMGLFSLNLLQPVEIQLVNDSITEEIEFSKKLQEMGILMEQVTNSID